MELGVHVPFGRMVFSRYSPRNVFQYLLVAICFQFWKEAAYCFFEWLLAICIPFMKKNDDSVFSIPLDHLFLVDCLLTNARWYLTIPLGFHFSKRWCWKKYPGVLLFCFFSVNILCSWWKTASKIWPFFLHFVLQNSGCYLALGACRTPQAFAQGMPWGTGFPTVVPKHGHKEATFLDAASWEPGHAEPYSHSWGPGR